MKNFTYTLLLLLLTSTVLYGQAFVTTWKTDNPGTSNDNQITIPTTGSGYNYSVDWGDGNSDAGITGDITHTYASAGTYTVSITGDFPRIYFNLTGDREKLMTIEQWGDIEWQSMNGAFNGCSNMTMPATDAPNLTNVTSMFRAFSRCSVFNGDISQWDVSNVTNMFATFSKSSVFNQDIGGWNVSNVSNMKFMFEDADAFDQNINVWNVGNVNTMEGMFFSANVFNQPLNNWDVSKVQDFEQMFYDAREFNQSLDDWDVSSATDMQSMFFDARKFNQPLGNWDVSSVTEMQSMFNTAREFNQDIGDWDVSNVVDMGLMFANCLVFNQDLSNWNVSAVTNMDRMFTNAQTFNVDLSNWDISQVINMSRIFEISGLSRGNYDNILNSWSQLNLQPNVTFGAVGVNYCAGADARQSIIDNFNWTITDGGEDCTASTETDILTFGFADFEDSETIDPVNHTIDVLVGFMADPSNLVAEFTLSPGATSDPASGTAQGFSTPFVYTITAEDATTTQKWTVTVEVQNVDPEDIQLSNSSIDEGNAVNAVVGSLSSTDGNLFDAHTYALVAGMGDTDNASFSISDDNLVATASFDFESKPSYSIRIKTTDMGGASFEKEFTISINDIQEMAQTISFDPIENKFFETGSINLTATSSSGLTVVFEILDGPASIAGNTLTMTATGQVTVKATQQGDAAYAAAPPVEQSFEIILVTGVPEQRGPQFKFYPNPVDRTLVVVPNGSDNQLSLQDVQGRTVTTRESKSNDAIELDVSYLPMGMYVLKLSNEAGVSQTKILKK